MRHVNDMRKNRFNILLPIIMGFFILFVSTTKASVSSDKTYTYTVVIDAGHGGKDSGAVGSRGREKSINLNVALKLGKLIEANCRDTKVIYTREKDVFVPLHQRTKIANEAKADLFISIHTNSLARRDSRVCGTETYTLGLHLTEDNLEVAKKENSVILIEDDYRQRYVGFDPNLAESYIIFEFLQDKYMAQSVSFAQIVQKQFRQSADRIDRGVHQAGFLVLRETSMPSVLIELGYITNPSEEQYLLSDKGSTALAQSICQAFLFYKQGNGLSVAESMPQRDRTEKEMDAVKTGMDLKSEKPVFKIQIFVSDRVLPSGDKLFKGLEPIGCYEEKGLYKYTYGESTDYNQILHLKRSKVDAKFKDAFIIAFKNGEKMDVNQAIREFKQNK